MNYLRNVVLMAFRAARPDVVRPTAKMIRDFDQTLFDLFDEEVEAQAETNEVELDDFSRSMLVYFSDRSTSEGIDAKVEDAFIYFLKVQPEP